MHIWAYRMDPDVHKQDISQEFPVHTIALSSHEPRDMKHLADVTSGTYSFIKGRDLANIKYAIALLIARITSVVAMSVRIRSPSKLRRVSLYLPLRQVATATL